MLWAELSRSALSLALIFAKVLTIAILLEGPEVSCLFALWLGDSFLLWQILTECFLWAIALHEAPRE